MRHRSQTNSRKKENRQLRDDYMRRVYKCEWCNAADDGTLAPHHIWGGTSGRDDLVSNLIGLCRDCHMESAHAKPIEARIACMYIKLRKGELDIAEINQAAGMNVGGWLETMKVLNCEPGYNERRIRLVEFFEGSE